MFYQCDPTAGPRAARGPPQRLQWPAEAFRKIFKFEICWKVREATFVSLNYLRCIKCICTSTINNILLCTIFIYLFIFRTN